MRDNIFFSVVSLFYSIMIIIVYFSKQRIDSDENAIYKRLVLANFLGLVIEIFPATIAIRIINNFNPKFAIFILKFILYYFIVWILLFTYYIYVISSKDRYKERKIYLSKINKMKKIMYFICIISIILITFLPLYANNVNYTFGPSANYVYCLSGIMITFIFFMLIRNFKNIRTKKYTPVFSFIFLGIVTMVVQYFNPELTLMIPMETFVTFLMYFTIENPDVKILNELYKNKEIMESNYEDKYNFLFEITQESRHPLKNMENICLSLNAENDIKVYKEKIKDLLILTKSLDFTINNVMNVSALDAQKINIVDKKYNLKKLCEDLTKRVTLENKKNIEFKYDIPFTDLYLYGDDMKLKQVLYSLIVNSLEKTNVGYVEFKVNTIEKYDYARLIFRISDSGPGIEIDKINEILSATGSLNKEEIELLNKKEVNAKLCQKVIKLMGGNLMIKSEIGNGSQFILTIDQKVYHDEIKGALTNYENIINNYKKVLIVSQDKKLISKIKNILTKNKVSYSVLYYGMDAVDKIKANKKYDFILISDEMQEISGLSTLKEMQKEKNFKVPCIVMLEESKKGLVKHYLKDGFSDYIINEDIDYLNKIIEKY